MRLRLRGGRSAHNATTEKGPAIIPTMAAYHVSGYLRYVKWWREDTEAFFANIEDMAAWGNPAHETRKVTAVVMIGTTQTMKTEAQ